MQEKTLEEMLGGNTSGSTGTTGNITGGGNQSTGNTTGGNTGGTTNNNQQITKSSNNYLKSLQLDIEGISPIFNKNTTQYYITVLENITNINVTAKPEDSKASVQVLGNTNIQLGNTKISIIVTAENGNKREYVINVTKTSNPELSNASLENLAIENAVLIPEFSADITDYTVEISEDIEQLNILAIPQQEAATVTIEGNENLQIGQNNIKITVLAQDGETTKIYNVLVIKNEVQEDIIEENVNINETNEQVQENLEEKVEKNNFLIFLSIGIVLVLGLVFVGMYYYKKRKD